MTTFRFLLALAATATLALALPARPAPAGAPEIEGYVFEDSDGNGLWDAGEPALPGRALELHQGGEAVRYGGTDDAGYYAFSPVADGGYDVIVMVEQAARGPCVDSFGGFFPFRLDDCLMVPVPWPATTPATVPVTVTSGDTVRVDFGLHRPEVAALAGVAVLEDGYPAIGTAVAAFVAGTECGLGEVMRQGGYGGHNYELLVLGESERPGCAREGDPVEFRVAGVAAGDPWVYETSTEFLVMRNLAAIEDHAWFWAEEPARPYPPGTLVQATIGGAVCGQASVQSTTHVFKPAVGFQKLLVPSSDIQPGCGYPGAVVSFLVDGELTGTQLPWTNGVQYADLNLPGAIASGDASCDGSVESLDALLTLRLAANLPVDSYDCVYVAADVDCDADRDGADALLILRFVAGLPTELPPNCVPIGRSGP